jgi:hypothetical protein
MVAKAHEPFANGHALDLHLARDVRDRLPGGEAKHDVGSTCDTRANRWSVDETTEFEDLLSGQRQLQGATTHGTSLLRPFSLCGGVFSRDGQALACLVDNG